MRRSISGPVGLENGQPLPAIADVPRVPKSLALVRVHALRRHNPVPGHRVPLVPPGRSRKDRVLRPLGPPLLGDQARHALVQRSPGADVILQGILREENAPALLPDEVGRVTDGLGRWTGRNKLLAAGSTLSARAVSL